MKQTELQELIKRVAKLYKEGSQENKIKVGKILSGEVIE